MRLLWPLTWPIRQYWLRSKRKLGKRLLVDGILKRLLPPPPRGFEAELPGGGRVFLHYREDIGVVTLFGGGFERAELERARAGETITETEVVSPGAAFHFAPGTVHRVKALEDTTILEVSTPHLDDVVRLEDDYGRT